jgi:hypothetical protein
MEIISESETNELKDILKNKCCNFTIDNPSKKMYNLFIKGTIFESDDKNEIYYLGVFYRYININYVLMKHYLLSSINMGNTEAAIFLWNYYMSLLVNIPIQPIEQTDKAEQKEEHKEGVEQKEEHKEGVEQKEDEDEDGINIKEKMDKIIQKDQEDRMNLTKDINDNDLRDYIMAVVQSEPNILFKNCDLFKNEFLNLRILNIFCEIINHESLSIDNFEYCVTMILEYSQSNKSFKYRIPHVNFMNFLEYISEILHGDHEKDEFNKYKICLDELFKTKVKVSQVFRQFTHDIYEAANVKTPVEEADKIIDKDAKEKEVIKEDIPHSDVKDDDITMKEEKAKDEAKDKVKEDIKDKAKDDIKDKAKDEAKDENIVVI